MKKFKLIKEYPGSPKLGHVICCDNFTHNGVDRHSCSDYPEFWEEIIEKDYEILSFNCNNSSLTLVELHENGKYSYKKAKNYSGIGKLTEEECLKDPYYKIHSVKRLSDGEVFTIGDKIQNGYGAKLLDFRIKGFDITNEYMVITTSGRIKLNKLEHRKQPLFTTEDGIDIYEDDEVVCVDIDNLEICANTKYKFQPMDVDNKNYLFFKDIKNAEEYVFMNKPCLSLNDLVNSSFDDEDVYEELVTKVKLKLK